MRIAFVCGFAWEPKGTVRARAHPLAVELVRRGHHVQIFVVPYDNRSYSGRSDEINGVPVHNVSVNGSVVSPVRRILHSLTEFQPDLVHVFKPKGYAGLVATLLLARGRRNLVLDCDDWEGWGGWNEVAEYNWLLKQFIDVQERLLTRRMPAVTVASRVLESRATELGQKNVFYVPNCLSDSNVSLLDSFSRTSVEHWKAVVGLPNVPVILYAGHFNPADDIGFLCRGMKQVLDRSDACLALVGDGPELTNLRAFFAGSERVFYFGRLAYEPYLRVLHACEMAVFPYPANPVYRAKCSARIIDFMAAGKPVVTTNLGQNGEYIQNNESGVLTPVGDELAFTNSVLRLIIATDERARLGENAAVRVREHFLWSGHFTDNCEAAYARVAGVDLQENSPLASSHTMVDETSITSKTR